MHITHVGGVLTPKKQTCSVVLNNLLDLAVLARTSLLEAYNPFAAKAPPTKDAHDTRRRRFNAEKQTY